MTTIVIMKTGKTVQSLLDKGTDFEHWIIALIDNNIDFITVAVDENEPLPKLDTVDGIIITGSPALLTDHAPWNTIAAEYLIQAYGAKKAILGICYGHQLLAHAFKGEVAFHPGGREIGSVSIKLTPEAQYDPLFKSLPSPFLAQVSHLQSVAKLPEGAVLLAGNAFEAHHGFRLGSCAWGIQFHPEFSEAVMRAYLLQRQAQLAQEGLVLTELEASLRPTPEAAKLLARFGDIVIGQALRG